MLRLQDAGGDTCTSMAEDGAWWGTVWTATLAEGDCANSAGAVAAALILKRPEEEPGRLRLL